MSETADQNQSLVQHSATPIKPSAEVKLAYNVYNAADFEAVVDYAGGPNRERGFSLLDVALGIASKVYFDWLSFKATAGAETSEDGKALFGVEDAYLSGGWRQDRFGWGFHAGAMKLPFSRQSLTSQYDWQFLQAAIVVQELDIRRDVGASFAAAISNTAIGWDLHLGLYNGRGHRVYEPDNDGKPAFVGRLVMNVLEPPHAGEGDARPQASRHTLQMGFGLSTLYNNSLDRRSWAIGVDGDLRWQGLSLNGEWLQTKYDGHFDASIQQSLLADQWRKAGWFAQLGYFVLPEHLQVALRYDVYRQEIASTAAPAQVFSAIAAALNYLVWPNYGFKVSLNYTHRREDGGIPKAAQLFFCKFG